MKDETLIKQVSRRNFTKALAISGLVTNYSLNAKNNNPTPINIIESNNINLTYSYKKVNFMGKSKIATAINHSVPAPILKLKENQRVKINVTNNLNEDTSIHWHGLILPSSQDGVPFISDGFRGIKPNTTFTYEFDIKQSGTYWYHSHSGFQEQTGAYGAIIIEPKKYPFTFDRQYVIQLSDWSDENPYDIYQKLKKLPDFYNMHERTVVDIYNDIKKYGIMEALNNRKMWNDMRMSDRDISDVTGATYTFLMNGITPKDGWSGIFKKGEKILLRIINSSAMTFFDLSIPNLKMTVVATDGQYIKPVSVDEIRLGVAETYDVLVEPKNEAYTIFAQAIDRSGYARGTLTPNINLKAKIPQMYQQPILSHADMGMSMNEHSGHKNMNHNGHHMSNKTKNDISDNKMGSGKPGFGSARALKHNLKTGVGIDMISTNPKYRLNDPGVGLRHLDKKVLTYADLRSLYKTEDKRDPSREIDLHLTGNMGRYIWSINGVDFKDSKPIKLKYNERIRVNLINHTMMNHPMHLHGMWSELETGDANYIVKKHTIIVQPGAKISYLLTADAKGGWAYHCHLIYHMAGMFRKVIVS